MSSKADRIITERHPESNLATNIAFSATTASGLLDPNTTYRFIATAQCYLKIEADNAAADTDDMYLPAGVSETFITTSNARVVHVLRHTGDGILHITPLTTRGK